MIDGFLRKLDQLKSHLRHKAPNVEVTGRSQSRRLEGQFSTSEEGYCYTSVTFHVQLGTGRYPAVIRDVVRAVAWVQYDVLRGKPSPLHVRTFPGEGSPVLSERLGDPRGAADRLGDLVAQAVGTEVAAGQPVIENLGRVDPNGLDVIFCLSRDIEVTGDALTRLTRSQKRVVWVLPAENAFLSPGVIRQSASRGAVIPTGTDLGAASSAVPAPAPEGQDSEEGEEP